MSILILRDRRPPAADGCLPVAGSGCLRLIAVAALTAMLLNLAPLASAQEADGVVIEQLQVDLWPQYDDPRLLVIYKGSLAARLDRPLQFPIPADADVNAVARVGDQGRLINESWESQAAGDRRVITFTPETTSFQIEYYVDVINAGPEKSFTVNIDMDGQWVNVLGVTVQRPVGATNLQGEPALSGPVVGRFGLSYYTRRIEGVQPGQVVQQTVTYTKPDDTLSIAQIQPTSSEPTNAQAQASSVPSGPALSTNLSGRSMRAFWLPAGATVIIVAGLALIGVGAWRARQDGLLPGESVKRRRKESDKLAGRCGGRRRSRRGSLPAGSAAQAQSGPAKFCHQCGATFESEDRFCAECGASRRGM